MDPHPQLRNPYTYSNLFNLKSLMNFQLPQPEDEFDYYANSSQDETRGSRGGQADRINVVMSEKKRRRNLYSSDEDQDGSYSTYASEERYRAMLGDHVHKYKRRHNNKNNNNLTSPASALNRMPNLKSSLGSKGHKGAKKIETASVFLPDITKQKLGNYREEDRSPHFDIDRLFSEPVYLDIGDGISYRIPPTYEMLANSLNLPRMSEIRVEEFYLKGTLDLGSLASMMAARKSFGPRSRARMGEPKSEYESLQARLKAQISNNSPQKFSLKVGDIALDLYSIPEGAAGGIRRSIMSDTGTLQIYYVKVLEKGDTYEIIERSLPKKQKVNNDPSIIEKVEMDKIGQYWVNMVRKDMPKHQFPQKAINKCQEILRNVST